MATTQGPVHTIDEYIAQFPGPVQAKLREMRELIRATAPAATEKISYGMPTFFLRKNLVHFGAFKTHIGFYPVPTALEAFAAELSPYKTSKGGVQFPLDQPLPHELIARIVAFRVAENLQK
jgi:uncharacterized protein YdhG (YjbR/CyaY superfamily)